ncbi:Tat pathway signal protein [Marispirochaeta aestuarii]|uniref:Tat pathway signal protein n=1 Tax=Marispirochaeta aestuarii TaxID=1963862 RepID=A0A1Y1RY76_9SPIO|nr:tripartite tricarboxylate transporter permease [Marispirochaeta aestuarii]ORC35366.1 Tat pathway signal protein [Marispirochaeta aestuarii]
MLLTGILAVLNIKTLLLIFIGVSIGIIFGAIPGMTATMAVALCLPITFGLQPINGISLLLGLYIGGISGGLITAILLKIPGTPASIATTFDGHPMAAKGEAGKALGIGIVYSFLGGLISILILIFVSPPLARIALKFSSYDYFSITVFALTMIASLSQGSLVKGLIAGGIGVGFSLVGVAPLDGYPRFTFGVHVLDGGFGLLPLLIGLYAVGEILKNSERKGKAITKDEIADYRIRGFGFSPKEFAQQTINWIRSSLIGTGIGILPGIGGSTSNIVAYITAKNQSRHPEKFGTGIMDGIVASESANNASVGGALVPLLTLGIPGDTVTAMLLGGLMIHGIRPGPLLFTTNGYIVYSIFAALIVANVAMLILEFFGMRGFVRLLAIPRHILFSIIMMLCVVGAYAANNRMFDVICLLVFGLAGYLLMKLKFPLPPVVLGFILGPIAELNLRRGLQLSDGSYLPFIQKPISIIFLSVALVSLIVSIRNNFKETKMLSEQNGGEGSVTN